MMGTSLPYKPAQADLSSGNRMAQAQCRHFWEIIIVASSENICRSSAASVSEATQ